MSETKRLRYAGLVATVFTDHGIGLVEPGGEFSVPADDAERFTRRADIEDVTPKRGSKGRRKDDGSGDAAGGEDGKQQPSGSSGTTP